MKPFSYSTRGHGKSCSKGKGFPRHLWKAVSLDEDTAVSYGYSGNRYVGDATRMSMNKSYGNLAEWTSENHPYPKHSHLMRWFRGHLGENVDTAYAKFKEAWDLQPALKDNRRGPQYWFDEYVYKNGAMKHYAYGDLRYYPFRLDNQNRIIVNPEYKHSWKKQKIYDEMFVRDNRPILDELQEKMNEQHSYGYWISGGDAVGPIGIKRQLWIIHPVTNMPVKAKVSLIRSNIFKKPKEKKNYYTQEQVPLHQKLSDDKLAYLRSEYTPVSVIWDCYDVKGGLRVQSKRLPGSYSFSEYKEWSFVVPKSQI